MKMQLILKYILRYYGNSKLNKFVRTSCSINHKINKNSSNLTFPIATNILDQKRFVNAFYCNFGKRFSSNTTEIQSIDEVRFEKVCDETLESLSEYFEDVIEKSKELISADVNYSSGVLTVNFGERYGTYVINRQTPNKQIWLSSPISGPKRYDFVVNGEYWLYKHDRKTLHQLLQAEVSQIINGEVDFSKCSYSHFV